MKATVSRAGTGEEAEDCLPQVNDIQSFYSMFMYNSVKETRRKNSIHRGNNSMIERNGK